MSRIQVVRTDAPKPSDGELAIFRRVLFELLHGFSDSDKKMWNRLWNRIVRMDAGELFALDFVFPRNYKFHKKVFALLTVGFDAWEPERKRKTYKGKEIRKDFDRFREEVTILAGYYEQVFDLKGRMRLIAKSISYAAMDDAEFEKYYGALSQVLLDMVLTNYRDKSELDAVVESILNFN